MLLFANFNKQMHSQYEYENIVNTVNVQEGQQTAPQLGFMGQDVASHCTIPQGPDVHKSHRCYQRVTDVHREDRHHIH